MAWFSAGYLSARMSSFWRASGLANHKQRTDRPELGMLPHLVPPGGESVVTGLDIESWVWRLGDLPSRVYAFEPDPVKYARLRKTSLGGVVLHRLALLDCIGVADCFVSEEGNRGTDRQTSLVPLGSGERNECFEVETLPLDAVEFDALSVLVLNSHGIESSVLHGAQKTLEAHRPTIFIKFRAGDNHGRRRVVEHLTKMDYLALNINQGTLEFREVTLINTQDVVQLLFLPLRQAS